MKYDYIKVRVRKKIAQWENKNEFSKADKADRQVISRFRRR